MKYFNDLLSINRNQNGDYYFIYKIKEVKNKINTKAKPRNEVIIVGVPKNKLINYLNSVIINNKE